MPLSILDNLAAGLKALNPSARIVVGGITASFYANEVLERFAVDYVVQGDAEPSLPTHSQGSTAAGSGPHPREQNDVTRASRSFAASNMLRALIPAIGVVANPTPLDLGSLVHLRDDSRTRPSCSGPKNVDGTLRRTSRPTILPACRGMGQKASARRRGSRRGRQLWRQAWGQGVEIVDGTLPRTSRPTILPACRGKGRKMSAPILGGVWIPRVLTGALTRSCAKEDYARVMSILPARTLVLLDTPIDVSAWDQCRVPGIVIDATERRTVRLGGASPGFGERLAA